jgi:hypothetical protein
VVELKPACVVTPTQGASRVALIVKVLNNFPDVKFAIKSYVHDGIEQLSNALSFGGKSPEAKAAATPSKAARISNQKTSSNGLFGGLFGSKMIKHVIANSARDRAPFSSSTA